MTFVCLTIQSLLYTATPGVPVVRVAVWVFQMFLHTLVSARVSAFVWAEVSVCKVPSLQNAQPLRTFSCFGRFHPADADT